MVKGAGLKSRHRRNVLTNMEKTKAGPLGALIKYKTDKIRVKVKIQ